MAARFDRRLHEFAKRLPSGLIWSPRISSSPRSTRTTSRHSPHRSPRLVTKRPRQGRTHKRQRSKLQGALARWASAAGTRQISLVSHTSGFNSCSQVSHTAGAAGSGFDDGPTQPATGDRTDPSSSIFLDNCIASGFCSASGCGPRPRTTPGWSNLPGV